MPVPSEFMDYLESASPEVQRQFLGTLSEPEQKSFADAYHTRKQAQDVPWYAAANRGLAAGTSLGFSDELAGLTDAVTQKLYLHAKGVPDTESFTDEYRKARNAWEDKDTQAQQAHPVIYGGTQAAGALAAGIAGPAAGAGYTGAVTTGAGYGAVAAAGHSDVDLTQGGSLKDTADDILEGAKTGAGFSALAYPVASAASTVVNKIGEKSGSIADEAMASALGAKSVGTKEADQAVKNLGRTVLDEGGFGAKDIVRIRNPGQRVVANLEPKVAANSEEIATTARDIAQKAKDAGVVLKQSEIGDRITGSYKNLGEPGYGPETKAVENAASEFRGKPQDEISFDKASQLKDKAQSNARYDDNATITDKEVARRDAAMQDVAEAQRQYLRDKALEVSPETSNRWDAVNEKAAPVQGAFKQAKKAAEAMNGPGREPHSLTALAAHLARTRGGAASAVILNNVSKASGPTAEIIRSFAKNPAIFGKYAKPLLDALEKGPDEFEKVETSLDKTNPTYRKLKEAAKLHEED